MLRDQFVLSITDDGVRKRLLYESKLTFDRAVELTSIVEQVSSDVDAMKSSNIRSQSFHKITFDRTNHFEGSSKNINECKY